MKLINRKLTKPTEPQETKESRAKQGGRVLLLVFVVWALVLVFIRSALHIGSPLVMFIIMVGLLFVGLGFYRYGVMRWRRWWRNFRPRLIRFLARFYR